MNDSGLMLESNKLSKSGVYKAEDSPKNALEALQSVLKEKHQKYSARVFLE